MREILLRTEDTREDTREETMQGMVVALLSDPATHGGEAVARIDTHISHIFLAGQDAWKLKRAVKLPFVDFSTLAARKAACEAELRLNRRTAPELYLEVVPATRAGSGKMTLGGKGRVVDWVVHMRRFPDGALLSDLAQAGKLNEALIDDLGDRLAKFHAACEPKPGLGGSGEMERIYRGLARSLSGSAGAAIRSDDLVAWGSLIEAELGRVAQILDRRNLPRNQGGGHVRCCHGDMHLDNIVLVHGRPLPFDALEFSERFAATDVLYDLAFPVMDLIWHGEPGLANRLLNRYLSATGDYDGLAAFPLFLSLRAAVRAMVLGYRAIEGGDEEVSRRSARYFKLAADLTRLPEPRLIAIGGLSGSGKTTVARALAPDLAPGAGAIFLSSDLIRKRLAGIAPETWLAPTDYNGDANARVYARLHRECRRALEAGQTVVADATFLRAPHRAAIGRLAAEMGLGFVGLWLDAPAALMRQRIGARVKGASDATEAVLARQLTEDIGAIEGAIEGDNGWRRVSAGGTLEETVSLSLGAMEGKSARRLGERR